MKTLDRLAHRRRAADGKFRATPLCDACNKPVGTAYFTDDEVCGASDGPGFYLCERKRCLAARDLDVEGRRALYTAKRAERAEGK